MAAARETKQARQHGERTFALHISGRVGWAAPDARTALAASIMAAMSCARAASATPIDSGALAAAPQNHRGESPIRGFCFETILAPKSNFHSQK